MILIPDLSDVKAAVTPVEPDTAFIASLIAVKSVVDVIVAVISDVVEKPDIKSAPSNHAVIGRYILPKKIFKKLLNQKKGKGGEIHITDSIRRLLNDGEKFIGHSFKGKYLDCGTMEGYIKSSVEISKL